MPVVCPRCGGPYAAHLAIGARCNVRWRGPSFDAYEAQSLVGLALADLLGVDVRDKAAAERFARDVAVRSYRASSDLNPPDAFDPGEGEAWEFHVAFREAVTADVLARAEAAVAEAVARARHFAQVKVVPAPVRETP